VAKCGTVWEKGSEHLRHVRLTRFGDIVFLRNLSLVRHLLMKLSIASREAECGTAWQRCGKRHRGVADRGRGVADRGRP